MQLYASKHPLEDTLVLEIGSDRALELHGLLVGQDGLGQTGNDLLSILEAFHAGTSLERFERPQPDEGLPAFADDALGNIALESEERRGAV